MDIANIIPFFGLLGESVYFESVHGVLFVHFARLYVDTHLKDLKMAIAKSIYTEFYVLVVSIHTLDLPEFQNAHKVFRKRGDRCISLFRCFDVESVASAEHQGQPGIQSAEACQLGVNVRLSARAYIQRVKVAEGGRLLVGKCE